MAFTTIGGYIKDTGEIISSASSSSSGSSFKVDHTSETGVYYINFDTPFLEIPAVSVTQVYDGDMSSGGGDIGDNAVIIAISVNTVKILTGNKANGHLDRQFSFVVFGMTDD